MTNEQRVRTKIRGEPYHIRQTGCRSEEGANKEVRRHPLLPYASRLPLRVDRITQGWQGSLTRMGSTHDYSLTGAVFKLGEDKIRESFAFARVGGVERIEHSDIALVYFLTSAIK